VLPDPAGVGETDTAKFAFETHPPIAAGDSRRPDRT
jgi:hypothetical protein